MLGVRRILNEMGGWPLTYAVTAHSTRTDPAILRANIRYFNDLYDAVFPPIQRLRSFTAAWRGKKKRRPGRR